MEKLMKLNKVRIKIIALSLLLCIGLNTKHTFAQNSDTSINKRSPDRSIIISSNVIYNYFTNKTLIKIDNPDGRTPNSRQIVYYWNYKYYDTYTFDLSLQYNRFLSKRFSLSSGIRFDQLKRVRKTDLYIDSSAYLPDEKKLTESSYSFSLPVSGNFYLKRFRFSLGLYAYFLTLSHTVYLYENDIEKKFSDMGVGLQFLTQGSIAFKLLQQKDIYLQTGVFHDFRFRNNYGYKYFFKGGLSLEI
jgi:hypothetical protein